MSDRWELAARLAALHDRDLDDDRDDADDPDSEAIRRELASADDDVLAAYADAVAIAREHREEDALASGAVPPPDASEPLKPGGTPVNQFKPPERKTGWRRSSARWMALAAVLAAVALVPFLRRGSSPADAGRFAVLLKSRDTGVPLELRDHPVSQTRGGDDLSADTALAVRLGILLLDLELAARARDREHTADLGAAVAQRLQSLPGSAPLAAHYGEIERKAGAPPEELEDLLKDGRKWIAGYFDEGLVALGSWNEAARLAAFRKDTGFFASRETRKVLGTLSDSPSLDPAARAAVDRIRAALPSDGTPDWRALSESLDELMRVMSR